MASVPHPVGPWQVMQAGAAPLPSVKIFLPLAISPPICPSSLASTAVLVNMDASVNPNEILIIVFFMYPPPEWLFSDIPWPIKCVRSRFCDLMSINSYAPRAARFGLVRAKNQYSIAPANRACVEVYHAFFNSQILASHFFVLHQVSLAGVAQILHWVLRKKCVKGLTRLFYG